MLRFERGTFYAVYRGEKTTNEEGLVPFTARSLLLLYLSFIHTYDNVKENCNLLSESAEEEEEEEEEYNDSKSRVIIVKF